MYDNELEILPEQAKLNATVWHAKRKSLLKANSKWLDQKFEPIAQHYMRQYDCTLCGNCCRKLAPGIDEESFEQLQHQAILHNKILKYQMNIKNGKVTRILKANPCSFLTDCKCIIYPNRPTSCADFPHLFSPGQKYKLVMHIENAAVCPIVYHTLASFFDLDSITAFGH